jgi:hypothetical protein
MSLWSRLLEFRSNRSQNYNSPLLFDTTSLPLQVAVLEMHKILLADKPDCHSWSFDAASTHIQTFQLLFICF